MGMLLTILLFMMGVSSAIGVMEWAEEKAEKARRAVRIRLRRGKIRKFPTGEAMPCACGYEHK